MRQSLPGLLSDRDGPIFARTSFAWPAHQELGHIMKLTLSAVLALASRDVCTVSPRVITQLDHRGAMLADLLAQ
jgi:hypothetical protein